MVVWGVSPKVAKNCYRNRSGATHFLATLISIGLPPGGSEPPPAASRFNGFWAAGLENR